MPTAVKTRQNIVRHGRKSAKRITSLEIKEARYYIAGYLKHQLEQLTLPRGTQIWRLCHWAVMVFEKLHYHNDSLLEDPREFMYVDCERWGREAHYTYNVVAGDMKLLTRSGFLHRSRAGKSYNTYLGDDFPTHATNKRFIKSGKVMCELIEEKLERQARRKNATGRDTSAVQPKQVVISQNAGSFQGVCEETHEMLSALMNKSLKSQDFDTFDSLIGWIKLVGKLTTARDMESMYSTIQDALVLINKQHPQQADVRAALHLFISKLYQKADSLQLVISFKEDNHGNEN